MGPSCRFDRFRPMNEPRRAERFAGLAQTPSRLRLNAFVT